MGDVIQKILPVRIELDSAEEYRTAFNACFLKNLRPDLNVNSNAAIDGSTLNQGGNIRALTPVQSPEIICGDIELPSGNNICIGADSSPVTNEVYWRVWNSLGNHSIWVYGINDQTCRKVYQGECLGFHFEPEHHIPAHRVALYVVYDADEDGKQVIRNKFYVFTDGINWQFFIDVESSIATDSYNPDTYPYFKTFYPHCDPCEFIQLGIRPLDCPKVLPFDDTTQLQIYEEEPENNNLKQKVWYFAVLPIDVFGRHGVLSPYSTAVFLDGGDCTADAEDIKCFKLQLDAGSPFVDKIVVYFSNNGIDWFKYDEIEKWEDCPSPAPSPPQDDFWERELALNNYYAPADSPECDDEGCFSTFTYTWDLNFSPALEPQTASIIVDEIEYSNSNVASYHGMIIWLNGLGVGTFAFDDATKELSTSSASIVYGTVTIGDSPVEEEVEPIVEAVDQCSTANTFIYQFCGNKQCSPVSPAEVARYFDDLPIASIAQTSIDDKVAYGNNLRGYDNFICPIENISIEAVQDEQCNTELVKIIVRAVIHNFAEEKNNPIHQLADSDTIAFGGYGTGGSLDATIVSSYNQEIVNSSKGFIGGFRGTPYKTISRQFRIGDPNHAYGVPQDPSTGTILDAYNGNYFYQEWEFNVPKNTYYIFEIYSHLAEDLSSAEGTSTYQYGRIAVADYLPDGDIRSLLDGDRYYMRETLIPACDGDYTYPYYVVIADLSQSSANAVGGYLTEQDTGIAVELADTEFATGATTIQTPFTDHNGFWFAMSDSGAFIVTISVMGSIDCPESPPDDCCLKTATTCSTDGARFVQCDKTVPLSLDYLANFNDCSHALVTGIVVDCDGNPIAGVPVMITRTGRVSMTDTDGNFTILVHDDSFAFFNFDTHRENDLVIFGTNGACLFTDGCVCDPCLPATPIDFNFCFNCPVVSQTIGTIILGNLITEGTKGVKTGGSYAVSIIGFDYLDRNNAAQLIGYFNVPTIQSNSVFAPYHFDWSFTGNLDLPSWVKKIRFAIRGNDYQLLLSWATNKVEFVDTSGNITSPAIAANIRVYIDGLNDFNTQNFFNTNTSYQWVKGDRIRFTTNGDGTPFDTNSNNGLIDLPVTKLENGNVLLIPFDSRLENLEAGATFELYRVPICETEPVYWEQCPSIPVLFNEETGTYEPTVTSGTIPFFDTYWFFRAIPMPDQEGLPIVYTAPHPYEHHSPSDFWGDHLFAIGRGFVRNENARQTWYVDEWAFSDSLLTDGVINGLATWRTENRKNYIVQGAGGIVAGKAQTGLLFSLCENNWFVVNIAQNLLLVTAQGNVQANPDYLGNKEQKIGSIYGCDYRDTNTIIFRQEWISWADVSRGTYCFSNYQTVWDITQPNEGITLGGARSYWIEKFRKIASLRADNQFTDNFLYLHAGFSIKSNEIVATAFGRINSVIEYVNEELDHDTDINETMSYNLSGYFSGHYGFTPEAFTEFDSALHGVQLLSFRQGKMWMHNAINPASESFNNFYGVQGKSIVKFVMNGGEANNQTQKIFLAVRVECKDQKFTCDQATTQTGQLSKIPAEAFEWAQNYFEAPILMDENSAIVNGISALLDGTNLYGNWIMMRFVQEEGKENEYFELLGFVVSSTESY